MAVQRTFVSQRAAKSKVYGKILANEARKEDTPNEKQVETLSSTRLTDQSTVAFKFQGSKSTQHIGEISARHVCPEERRTAAVTAAQGTGNAQLPDLETAALLNVVMLSAGSRPSKTYHRAF